MAALSGPRENVRLNKYLWDTYQRWHHRNKGIRGVGGDNWGCRGYMVW